MKKQLFYFSVALNVVLLVAAVILFCEARYEEHKRKFIDEVRVQDTKIFEHLLLGRLSKQQATQTLESYFGNEAQSTNWFVKPEDHGIGAGSFFMLFDDKGQLSKVEINDSFDGP